MGTRKWGELCHGVKSMSRGDKLIGGVKVLAMKKVDKVSRETMKFKEGLPNPIKTMVPPFPPRHRNTGLVSSGVSLTSWGEGASLALVGHHSSDGIMIKILYGVDVLLCRPASHPIFSY